MLTGDTYRDVKSGRNALLVTAQSPSKYIILMTKTSDKAVWTGEANVSALLLYRNEDQAINWAEASVDEIVDYVTKLRTQLRVALMTSKP